MRVLLAPDSFKGSLSSREFCQVAEEAIHSCDPAVEVISIPLADGGEGTVETLVYNTDGQFRTATVTGPTSKPVQAKFGLLGDGTTAVIEMAAASGLPLVPPGEENPMTTTTYGTGELVKIALDRGCTTIIMGIGGSATNDGGAGMLQALGFGLLNGEGEQISPGAAGLLDLREIDISQRDSRLDQVRFLVACDVDNPLSGPTGAAYIYAPQKGATPEMVPVLDEALQNFAQVIETELGQKVAQVPGGGAAGGLGAGLLACLNAQLRPGFEIIQEAIGFQQILAQEPIDLVITGEGELNYQTVHGKLPVGVARLAKEHQIPVIAIVGKIGEGAEKVYDVGIDSIFSIADGPMTLEEALTNSHELLADTIQRVFRLWQAASTRNI